MKSIPRFVILFTGLYGTAMVLLAGCTRPTPVPLGPTAGHASQFVNQPILQLFKTQGIDCRQKGDWIEFPNRSMRASGVIAEESKPESAWHSVQLDFRMELDSGESLTETLGGTGESRDT